MNRCRFLALAMLTGCMILFSAPALWAEPGVYTLGEVVVTGTTDGARFALRGSDGSLSPVVTGDLVLDAVADRVGFTSLPADAGAVNRTRPTMTSC